MLTIETGRLADLWLPTERSEREAVAIMHELCAKSCNAVGNAKRASARRQRAEAKFNAYIAASCALDREWEGTVREITARGGLLLIGGAR